MKVHYINILLFALPLNILVYNQRNHNSTTPYHTQTTRLLCECKLYEPANYDSDAEMKRVMQQFEDRTSQRFHDYDDRMIEKRKQCKDRCDKEIQKIILKDKLEKELMDKFATLHTDIQSDAIPTCVCEKSLADKVEKECLKCAQNLGGIVAPSTGVLTGIAEGAVILWKPAALEAAEITAKAAAIAAGKAAGEAAGKKAVIGALKHIKVDVLFPGIYKTFVNTKPYTEVTKLAPAIVSEYKEICEKGVNKGATWEAFEEGVSILIKDEDIAVTITQPAEKAVPSYINSALGGIKGNAEAKIAEVTAAKTPAFKETYMGAVDTAYGGFQTAIIASIVAIVIIVLIMVIIYKILRYRRKKKMKKKLQYIKLLEE
ncbi:rifin [Plasmodium reichenowi]|uniref:Rifin n=1 Tax=Plasmodium reichenowi TaxID=5854 RepID=A0A060RPU9_PLARE|nr:rifin [Plasmodium reichenowi]